MVDFKCTINRQKLAYMIKTKRALLRASIMMGGELTESLRGQGERRERASPYPPTETG